MIAVDFIRLLYYGRGVVARCCWQRRVIRRDSLSCGSGIGLVSAGTIVGELAGLNAGKDFAMLDLVRGFHRVLFAGRAGTQNFVINVSC